MTIIVQKLGWTLLHFLWQGTAIAVVYAVVRSLLARSLAAAGRYTLACVALTTMALAPPLTFLMIPQADETLWTISAAQWQQLAGLVVAVWILGVLAFSIRLLGAWRFTARLRSTSSPASAEWQQTLEQIAARVGALRSARLLVSSLVNVPTVIGWLRPVILVPVEALTGLPAGHLTALLAHEMAHIRRHDYLANILQSVAETLLFYHPAVWWISEQIRCERELCCDDLAVAASGDVLTYARALAALESQQTPRLRPALAANGGSLVNRIRRLIEPAETVSNNAPAPGAAWAMALLWLAGVGVATVHAAQTPRVVRAVDLGPVAVESPLPNLAIRARRTLLYDPFMPAPPVRLAQLQPAPVQGRPTAASELASPWRHWLDEDVLYIISAEERSSFLLLSTDNERELFVEQFWLRRDPTPDTVQNEFKEEHYRRIAYANLHFSSRTPGWITDRGRIYISYGPPDEIDSHPSGLPYPSETWRYRFIEGMGTNVAIEFSDPVNSGEYRMAPGLADQLKNAALSWPGGAMPLTTDPQIKANAALDATLGSTTAGNALPMQVRVDYVRITDSSTMANVTVQFENRDLQFEFQDGAEKATVNLFGRITTMTRRPVTTFEKPLAIMVPPEILPKAFQQRSVYQQSVPLAPGRYRLRVVAKDIVAGNLNNYEVVLDVPVFSDKLAASSLVIADDIARLPARVPGGGMFAIGDTKVRPRLGNRFTSEEKMGIYLQLYNFTPDATTQRPVGSVEYEVDKAGSNEKVMDFSEEVGSMANASASVVTIEKMLPLKTFAPGNYTLRVKATDRTGNQTLQRQESFTVSPD